MPKRARKRFSRRGVQRLLDNVLKSLTATSLHEPVGDGADGRGGRHHHVRGRAPDSRRTSMTLGRFRDVHGIAGVPDRADVSDREHRNAAHRGAGRTRPHARSAGASGRRIRIRAAPLSLPAIDGRGGVRPRRTSRTTPAKTVLHDVSFRLRARNGDGAGGPVGLREVHHHRADRGVSRPASGNDPGGWRGSVHGAAGFVSHAAWAWCCRRRFCSTGPFARTWRSRGPNATEAQILEACRIARVDEFAEGFEKKYDTIVGERGVKLVGRPAPARFDRARDSGRSAHFDSGRSYVEPRFGIRGDDSGRPASI